VGYVVGCAWSLWMFPTAISFVARSSWMRATLMTLLPAVGSLRALANHTYLPQDEWLVFWYAPSLGLVCNSQQRRPHRSS
jgi:energy-converting hydrogenase Eha subunit G